MSRPLSSPSASIAPLYQLSDHIESNVTSQTKDLHGRCTCIGRQLSGRHDRIEYPDMTTAGRTGPQHFCLSLPLSFTCAAQTANNNNMNNHRVTHLGSARATVDCGVCAPSMYRTVRRACWLHALSAAAQTAGRTDMCHSLASDGPSCSELLVYMYELCL
jgi:hypothetical protein